MYIALEFTELCVGIIEQLNRDNPDIPMDADELIKLIDVNSDDFDGSVLEALKTRIHRWLLKCYGMQIPTNFDIYFVSAETLIIRNVSE